MCAARSAGLASSRDSAAPGSPTCAPGGTGDRAASAEQRASPAPGKVRSSRGGLPRTGSDVEGSAARALRGRERRAVGVGRTGLEHHHLRGRRPDERAGRHLPDVDVVGSGRRRRRPASRRTHRAHADQRHAAHRARGPGVRCDRALGPALCGSPERDHPEIAPGGRRVLRDLHDDRGRAPDHRGLRHHRRRAPHRSHRRAAQPPARRRWQGPRRRLHLRRQPCRARAQPPRRRGIAYRRHPGHGRTGHRDMPQLDRSLGAAGRRRRRERRALLRPRQRAHRTWW
ncbi:uncharacterized protein SOCE836_011660 [Sorangium cellulosum]|uniref:Uncharacterized protein n=1 Tax=Sorangium cellulosum TaxID=56 RepID=A0A4P2QGT8_SORCE|nr:uncharacterized protein SOCE836_011660 [Sorangium cellulosum]WCQ88470.1 hypothetical protein NQZ70_01147 [Sorangium sp. Soce836]